MSKALQLARYQTGLMEEGSCSFLNSGSVSTQEEGSSSSLNFGSSSTEEGSNSSLNLPSSSNEVELEGRKNGGKKAWEKTMVDMAVLSEEKAIGENAETEIVEEKCVRTRLGNYSHEPWLIEIQQKIDLQHKIRELSEQVCIYRVIKPVMIGKPEAYEPVVVSLGPYHHKSNQKLSAMDQHKVEAVSRTLKKLKPSTRDLIEEIRLLDGKIRKCYDEEIEWNADILSRMIQMDACFILEFFICLGFERDMNDVDCFSLVFQNRGRRNKTSYVIEQDIFKLENQIPLFVLVTILERICGDKEDAEWNLAGILAGATAFTGRPFKLVEENKFQEKMWKHITDGAHHLLDLRRRVINDLLTPSCGQSDPTESPYTERSIPPAKLLKKAGIKFKPGHFQFKKRRFGSNVLILPPMSVDENTDTVLRNLMAFEECRRCSWTPEDAVISEYICIINHLIDSEIVVSLLTKEGIITSYLGSDADVAKMFNGVCNGLTETKNEHFEVAMNKAKEQYYSQLRMWISQFKNEYFSKPWQFVSLAVGILILVMTAAQFAFAVKRNNKSR